MDFGLKFFFGSLNQKSATISMAIFGVILGDNMANLGLIDFKLGLYIKVNVNEGQNKFEVHISKHLAKMAINWHKIGQMPLLGKKIKWA